MTHAIELSDLAVSRGGRTIVSGISIGVERHSWLGVIGANGSGKTTLLRAVAGRLPIESGRCAIEGSNLADDRASRAARIGFAPPIDRLPDSLRLRELLELAGERIVAQQRRCEALWLALGIPTLLDRPIGEYSSGMRQRASIALAFASAVPIVVLDEPFNWLDPVAAYDARMALASMVERGLTLITALHDLSTLCGSCSAGIVMAGGRVTLRLQSGELRAGHRDLRTFERDMILALRS